MANFLNRIGQLGLGVAIVGGVVNSALYNGKLLLHLHLSDSYRAYFYFSRWWSSRSYF